MPQDYEDDRYDDDYDDRRRGGYEDDDRRDVSQTRARDAVRVPAILQIILAVVSLGYGAYMLIASEMIDAQWDMYIDIIKNDPKLDAQKKADMVQNFEKMRPMFRNIFTGIGVAMVVSGLLIIFGSIQMMNLKSRGMSYLAAILVMIPAMTPCCILGLPFGIWSIVVMGRYEVKMAFDANTRGY